MKKWYLAICLLFLGAAIVLGARRGYYPSAEAEGVGQGYVLMSSQIDWNTIDTTTSSGTEPTDLAVGERTYATVIAAIAAATGGDEEISYARLPATWNNIRFRCLGVTNDGTITYQVYLGTLGNGTDCELAYAGQLAFVVGQQASTVSDYEMADAVTVTTSDWTASYTTTTPGADRVAETRVALLGADLIVVVPTVASCDARLIVKGY